MRDVLAEGRSEGSARLEQFVEELTGGEEAYWALFETVPHGIVCQNVDGHILAANAAAQRILGLTLDQMVGRTSIDPRWRAIHEDGSDFPGETHPAMVALRTVAEVRDTVMGVFNPHEDDWVWISIDAVPRFKRGSNEPHLVYTFFEDITERRRAQQALEESERRYRRLVEGAPDIVYIYSNQRGAVYWSSRVRDVLGFTPQDLRERPFLWHDSIHPDDLIRVDQAIEDRHRGKHAELEYRIRDADGQWHWFRDRFIDKRRVGDEILIEGLATDITERKQAEEDLRRAAEEMAALYAISEAASTSLSSGELLSNALEETMSATGADAGWILLPGPTLDDPPRIAASRGTPESLLDAEAARPFRDCPVCAPMLEGADLRVDSLLICECLCPHQEGLLGEDLEEVTVVPLIADGAALGFLHLAWAGSAPELGTAFLTSAGRAIGLSLRNSQLYQQARKVVGLQAVNRIATAAISAIDEEVVLRRILRMTCEALDAAGGSIRLRDPDSAELRLGMGLSDHVGELQGIWFEPGGEMVGWVLEHERSVGLKDEDREPSLSEGLQASLVPEMETLISAPMSHMEEEIGVIEISDRRSGEFDENDLDLLESVAAIAAIAVKNADLYRELANLLFEKRETEAQLIHSEKMSALGRLTAALAHEINNPLQAVQGYLSLTREELDDSGRKDNLERYLSIATEEVERISSIVSRMRDFYRQAPKGFAEVDLHAELECVLEIARWQLEQSDVVVERQWLVDAAGRLLTVVGNANQLRQVFLNLVINAIDAMPEGGTLCISTALELGVGGERPMVGIAFVDTGSGIAPEVQARLFEPFFTTKEEGSGLGLSISYEIVQGHGGDISVTSEGGRGSMVTVWLPADSPMEPDGDAVVQ